MTTIAQAKTAIYTSLAAQLGITTIWAKQRAKQPALPYAKLQVISNLAIGHDERTMVDTSTDYRTQTGQREIDVSITVYAEIDQPNAPAQQVLENVRFSFGDADQIETYKAAGLGTRGMSSITDVSFLQETDFLDAAEMTVSFGYQVTDAAIDVSSIDQIDDTELTFEQPGLADIVETIDQIGPAP